LKTYFHSVRLKEKHCRGCVNCTKRCPTEAIRVRSGKAKIIESRCIDCGECIRHCLHRAKAAITDDLEILNNFQYTIALPAPALYAQFPPDISVERLIAALRRMGFDEVYEVAKAAEIVTAVTCDFLAAGQFTPPIISSACPAVVRLMQVRFPELLEHLLPLEAPIEIAAYIARKEAVRKTGWPSDQIGIFFITPCPAKVTAIKQPLGIEASHINGAIALNKIYPLMLKTLPKECKPIKDIASHIGVGWALAGGESTGIPPERRLVISDIHAVVEVLEAISLGKLKGIDYVECLACAGGCIGGPLTVENRFTAELNMKQRLKKIEGKRGPRGTEAELNYKKRDVKSLKIQPIETNSLLKLDEDIGQALVKVELLEKTLDSLPGFDCGSCGSPNCKSLAEDIVRGSAALTDCVFKLRERVRNLAEEIVDLAHRLPPVMSRDGADEEGEET
jgi:iron only hydrogenase large subunit-like protein